MRLVFIITLGFILFSSCQKTPKFEIDLKGEWTYKLDKLEIGIKEKWFDSKLTTPIQLPGALRDYSIGEEPNLKTKWTGSIYDSSWYFNPKMEKYRKPGNMKFPFWLTPVKHYIGMTWFQKEIEIPANWQKKDAILYLERPHWQTAVWFDSSKIGSDNSLSTPHQYVIPKNLITEGKHKLTIRVDNAIRDVDPGINSHSISDHTQGNWNGIIGKMKLIAKSQNRIEHIKIIPNISKNIITASILLSNKPESANTKLKFSVRDLSNKDVFTELTANWNDSNDSLAFEIPMGENYKTWSEFSPNRYELTTSLIDDSGELDMQFETFGMREFAIKEKHFEINGIPIFLRGTTECCVFPLTGYPPTNVAEWSRIFNICKNFGLNHMRFHSYCPPEAAFIAADKAGIYLQVEGPSWAKYSTSLGRGKPIDQYLMDETKRIIDTYGNHPSFCMMAYGNEPSGNYVPYLNNWVDHFREYDSQRVYTGASTGKSWAIIENSDFLNRAAPRGLNWKNTQPESCFDYNNKTENQNRPYITFEMGQWCVFPNFEEIDKYTGSLKAKNFELFQENLKDQHMSDQANDFLMASGKLQASCYKQEIEATLRTTNLAGFQLLSLNDFSGQGTALVGVLDAFWDEKGYVTAKEFSAFCNQVVPLIRLNKFTYESNDTITALAEIANFSGVELKNPDIKWKLNNTKGVPTDSGSITQNIIAIGNGIQLGKIKATLTKIKQAEKLTLSLSVNEYTNKWNIWVYPVEDNIKTPESIHITNNLDTQSVDILNNGGKVLLLADGLVENGKDVIQYQIPAFWNTSWFRMRPPHTTGILIKNEHPALEDFPTDYYSDLQWWDIANRQQIMNLDKFPTDFKPIVQPIDTWFLNRRLAMMFEAKIGEGKLMVCSMDLSTDLKSRPVARQLKSSILKYMNSEKFQPQQSVNKDIIHELFEVKEREGWNSYVNENP